MGSNSNNKAAPKYFQIRPSKWHVGRGTDPRRLPGHRLAGSSGPPKLKAALERVGVVTLAAAFR